MNNNNINLNSNKKKLIKSKTITEENIGITTFIKIIKKQKKTINITTFFQHLYYSNDLNDAIIKS